MSGFTGHHGRNQQFSSNCFQGQLYTNFDGQYNSVNSAYEEDYSVTGDNSYNYEGFETDASYWQDEQYEAGTDYGTDAYQNNGNVYGYEEQSTGSVYGNQHTLAYEEASYGYKNSTHSAPQPVLGYHNFTRGNSNFAGRGRSSNLPFGGSANRSRGVFNNQNRGQPVNCFARRGFGDNFDRGRGRSQSRGRGQFNLNRNQFQQHRPEPRFRSFKEKTKATEKGQFEALEGNKMGQFALLRNEDSSTEGKVIEDDCKGQFGLVKESLKQETFDEPSTGISSGEQPGGVKFNSEQSSNDQIKSELSNSNQNNSKQPSIDQIKSEQPSIDLNNSEQPSILQANSEQANGEQSSNELCNNEQLVQKEVKEDNTEETDKQESDNEEESDSSDEDTDFCKYCKLNFSTPKAYHAHTRGLQHTTLVMEAKAQKGDKHYTKEEVEASVLEVHIPKPKIEKTETEECEENWMNLDDDMTNYVKEWMNPENKDLNPSDVGKNPLPNDFNCALCNIKCTGPGAFKMHIDGKNHRNNIEAAKQGAKVKQKKQAPGSIMIETKDRPSKFLEMVKGNTNPMLGLEFVTEFQKSDIKAAARYVCNLCEAKCDGSTIVPHVTGLKHRLKYLQLKRPTVYDHVTKFSSKKKKSEMSASIEDLTRDIEKAVGRGDVKVKVELEDFEDENDLKESMIRHSKELAETVKKLEEINPSSFSDEPRKTSKVTLNEPPVKKARILPEHVPEQRSRPAHDPPSSRREPSGKPMRDRDPYYDSPRRPPLVDHRHPLHDAPRHPPYDVPRHHPYDAPRHHPYDVPRRPPYDDQRRPGYDDPRDPYNRRYHDDFRASYRDRFDPYRLDDPMYERRMFDERRRLDGLMAARYRLDDPYAERRRVDDIVERRRYLDELERSRLEDIMERRKRLQETDVDYLRLKRFMDRDAPATTSSPSISEEEKKRLDDVLARREALKASENQAANQGPNQGSTSQGAIQQDTFQGTMQEGSDIQAIQNKLASHRSTDPEIAAKQDKAAEALREEAAKNPHINIAEVMTSLSTSMIATEDDAAMALQISNALTQALLKYRLMNASNQLTSLAKSVEPALEQKVAEPSIPGLGVGSSTSSVPSFLRTSQQDSYNTNYSTLGSDTYSYTLQQSLNSASEPSPGTTNSFLQTEQLSTASSVTPVASSSYLYSSQPSSQSQYSYSDNTQGNFAVYSQTQQTNVAPAASLSTGTIFPGTTFSGTTFPGTTFAGTTFSGTTLYSGYSQNQQSVTASASTMAPSQTVSLDKDKIKKIINTSNIDQPQKFLLESIRKQTELLRQKIQASTGIGGDSVGSGDVQSQLQHVPGSTSSDIGYSSPSLSQSPSVSSHMTSPPNEMPVSSYSSQYYQYNYHTSTPNPAPPPVPPEQPPLPSEPAPPLPLPTNDLPPMRRKRHR